MGSLTCFLPGHLALLETERIDFPELGYPGRLQLLQTSNSRIQASSSSSEIGTTIVFRRCRYWDMIEENKAGQLWFQVGTTTWKLLCFSQLIFLKLSLTILYINCPSFHPACCPSLLSSTRRARVIFHATKRQPSMNRLGWTPVSGIAR